ncbi:DUF3006 family protein [Natronobiforma cellulositropha]|uniref:DUF3006 family protein n=1 Tax=Natronobiforma cellulositropha TaxID=1679076 RepID=UPI0021D5845A|nr:DUF3006 family protein [Natronobiforma cellulositropha]
MSEEHTGRRTVLKSLLAVTLAGLTLPTAAAARRAQCPRELPPHPATGETLEALTARPDTVVAVVDRIVDGAHVVLLLEERGELVDELVVPVGSFPPVEEGEVLLVTLERGSPATVRRLENETERRRRERRERLERLRS